MAGMHVLLALEDRIPNEDAVALSPTAGWLMLGLAVLIGLLFVLHHERWRRLWHRAEDPRPMAVFRILFGLCAMCNVNGLWEHFEYLFTDEGIFLGDVARHVFARNQFDGFGNGLDGDPYGFFDFRAFSEWLKGPKYSLLLFWDTPAAFWLHWVAFQLAMTLLVIGLWTKYVKWIAWFLFHSIIVRNNLFWEGTENVYRTFFFYLAVSRCGHAYSVDNWLRCRTLRGKGRLSEPGQPGGGAGSSPTPDHPHGLEPIYRLIPSWPRLLMILQIAVLYCYTGAVKNGSVWLGGDAFYYALNLDHFWRFPPQHLSAWLGTNLFRVNTHVTHWWETLFPLVVVGLVARWCLREAAPTFSPLRRTIARVMVTSLGLGIMALVILLYPVHYPSPNRGGWTLQRAQQVFAGSWLVAMAVTGWGYWRLRYRPFRLRVFGRERVLDLYWFCSWVLGRRIWLSLGIVFHGHLIVLMNIGWFSPGVLAGYVCFLNGSEVAALGIAIGRWLRWAGVPMALLGADVRRPVPAEDPTLSTHPRDAVQLPESAMLIAVALAVIGVVLHWQSIVHFGWSLAAIAAFLAGTTLREWRAARHRQLVVRPLVAHQLVHRTEHGPSVPLSRPWAYGAWGRFVAGSLCIYHLVGVACWLLPDKDSFSTWRTETHEPFKWWLQVTQTSQGWKMFAPNPPRSNLFMRVLVTDRDGEVWDLNTDMYHESKRPIPWIWYTRERKMNRRISGAEGGGGSWYQKWHARYICRKWALDHGGEAPKKVELVKISYGIPTPEFVAENGPYDPWERLQSAGKQTSIYSADCDTEVDAQLPNAIRRRHGLPEIETVRRWNMLRDMKKRWDEKLARERASTRSDRDVAED